MFKRSASQPLLLRDDSSHVFGAGGKRLPLYNYDAMLELSDSLCQGYIILLTGAAAGGVEQPARISGEAADHEARERAYLLAFAALTDGNVIDACFGMRLSSKKNASVSKLIREAKSAIDEAFCANDRVGRLVVEAYQRSFETVIDTHKKMDKLNFFTRCFLERKIRNNARAKLATNFVPLEQAVAMAAAS